MGPLAIAFVIVDGNFAIFVDHCATRSGDAFSFIGADNCLIRQDGGADRIRCERRMLKNVTR